MIGTLLARTFALFNVAYREMVAFDTNQSRAGREC
jgi:hypothetical protein